MIFLVEVGVAEQPREQSRSPGHRLGLVSNQNISFPNKDLRLLFSVQFLRRITVIFAWSFSDLTGCLNL